MADDRRFEPWPVAVGLALLFMIGVSVSFFVIANANPDPVLTHDARPGMAD